MLAISTNRFGGKPRTIDLHSIRVPGSGGKFAHELTGIELLGHMKRLGVTEINPSCGWQDAALRLAVWMDEQDRVDS